MQKTDVVKYRNDINGLSFRGFNGTDYDIFLSLCTVIANQENQEITLSYAELRDLIGTKSNLTKTETTELVKHMGKRLLKLNFEVIKTDKIILTPFFSQFEIEPNNEKLTFQLSDWSIPLLNDLQMNFTLFELKDFVHITSKHSKTLFRLLKQYRSTGIYNVSINDFYGIMDVPKSYGNNKITQRIIDPSVKELQPYFNNLTCEVIRDANKRGRPVTGYRFTFQKQLSDLIEKKHKPKKNAFNDFEQRNYDYDELERQLTGN